MTNNEGWNSFANFFLKQTEYIHSTFDVHQFLFRFTGRFSGQRRGAYKGLPLSQVRITWIASCGLLSSNS
jgi:hypothetical protein